MEPEATVGTKTKSCTSVVERCVCSRSDAGDDDDGGDDILYPVRRTGVMRSQVRNVVSQSVRVCSVGSCRSADSV